MAHPTQQRSNTMNKAELINQLATEAGVTKKDAEAVLNAFTSTVTAELKLGNEVALVGFGTFKVSPRAARQGRNPSTGEAIDIAASNSVSFKAGKTLKSAVN
nr:HU family DNA-binding protein [Ephemeroptericola cinctiostellae]